MNKNQIFKKGSTTYYFSSIFFPENVRNDVFTLYAFVRTADDYVDQIPQDKLSFLEFKNKTHKALEGGKSQNVIIDDLVLLANRKKFEKKWTEAFLESMELDLEVKKYETFSDLEKYIYGSADVIGLMMARIMDLPDKSLPAAQMLGKSMQFINFIRDIGEDLELGRVYMPQDDLRKFGLLENLSNAKENKTGFEKFICYQIEKYDNMAKEAETGFAYIMPRLRASIMTANDMYKWTSKIIEKNPQIIFAKKVKPQPIFVLFAYLKNLLKSYLQN